MVVIALAMVAIIGMAALVLDGGYAYLERRRVQNAADAAALAGVRALAKGENELVIRQAIDEYATRNGIANPSTNITAYFVDENNNIVPNQAQQIGHNGQVPKTARAVVVRAQEQHNTFFANVLGFPTIDVRAVAQAGYGAAAKITGLLPMAVYSTTLAFGEKYVLWDTDWLTDTQYLPDGHIIGGKSQRGWLNFNGGSQSNSDLVDWMTNGYDMEYPVPLWINGGPGVHDSVVQAAEKWVDQVVFVPMYDGYVQPGPPPTDGDWGAPYPYPGNDQRDYHIIGFGAFRVTSVIDVGNSKAITGSFFRWVASPDPGGPVDLGTVAIRLTQPVAVP
jgi:Flp pilus assembly protein TadG